MPHSPRTAPDRDGPRGVGSSGGHLVRVRTLGQGSLARVDLVRDPRDGSLLARKQVPLPEEERLGVLRREYRIRSRLGHPQVPAAIALGVDRENELATLLLEFVDGEELVAALGRLGPESVAPLLAQALNVLGWLHRRDVIHGDLKPENICVQGTQAGGTPLLRLLDFGTALDLAAGDREWLGGTPAFLAPYLRETGEPDPRSDLFALGRTFQRALEATGLEVGSETTAVLGRLAHADAHLTYADAEQALDDLLARCPELAEVELPRPTEPPFTGRRSECALLSAQREALAQGLLRESLVVIAGEQGLGKSRLLRELEHESVLHGLEVIRLRCPQACGPLEPVLELAARILPSGHPDLERLARSLSVPSADAERPTQGLLRDLARALRAQVAGRPVLVLLDDLEHADEPTLEFLRIHAGLGMSSGPLVVAAFRNDEATPADRLLELGERVSVLRLGPQPIQELRELLTASAPRSVRADSPDGARIDEWVALSLGNPGLARALALAGGDRGAGTEPGGEALLRSVLISRLAALGAAERALLDVLAVLERPTPLPLVAAVRGRSEADVLEPLERLVVLGLVEPESHRNGRRYRVAAEALARHLRSEQDETSRRALHARALSAWSDWPFPVERPTDMLARHAVGAGQIAEAIELGRAGAARLLAQGGLRAAEDLITSLLPIVPEREHRARADLACSLADARLRTGRPREARQALEELHDEIGHAELEGGAHQEGELAVRVLRLLGTAAEVEGDLGVALELLQDARARLGEDTSIREQRHLLERLGAVRFRLGGYDEARSVWEEGLGLGRPDDFGLARSELLNDLGVLDWRQGDLDSAVRRHLSALEVRRARGDLDGESRSLTNLANVYLRRGELTQAREHYEESLRLKRLVGSLPSQAVTLRSLGTLHRNQGEYGRAIASLRESVQLRVAIGDRIGEAATRRILAVLLIEKGEARAAATELETCRRTLESGDASAPERAALREAESRFALEEGRWDQAATLASEGIELLEDAPDASLQAGLLRLRGRARRAAGDEQAGSADLEHALRAALEADDLREIGWSHLELGRTLLHHGRTERAAYELETAERLARDMQASHLLAEALLLRADVVAALGSPDAATVLLTEGERLAARVGVPAVQLSAWHRMGRHAFDCGFVTRAVQWWRRGAEVLRDIVAQYEEELRDRFLARPEHREIVAALESVLAGEENKHTAEETVVRKQPTASLEDLLAQSKGFGAPGAGGPGRSALRPETLERLLEISNSMGGLRHREEILGYLGARLEELFGAENTRIILIARDGSFHLMGESAEASQDEISRTLLDRVLSERRPILVQDTSHDPELYDKSSVHRLGLSSVLCAPLIVDEEVIGVIQFEHRSKPGPFTEEDLAVLRLFSHQAATTLKSMLLVEQLDETIDRMRVSEAKLVAGERLRALGEMSAGVAHDFNNLLTIIVGITDLMRTSEGLSPELRADVETLETISETAAATVRRLQEFRGVPTSGEARTSIDAMKVARQAVELGRRRFLEDARHEMRLELDEIPTVFGHESELREVLLNLVINAIEAMPKGGTLTMRTREEDGSALIEVEDEGSGIDPELGQRVFEPFFTTKPTGQGMGLSICWGIVKRMEGTIEAEPAPTGGTVVRLRLPAAPPGRKTEVPSLAEQGKRRASSILVVDDDPIVREVICRMLTRAGFHPVGSSDGPEALALFEAETFDLVLTDYAMPEMDGAKVARAIKQRRADCPVVLLTGRSPIEFGGETELGASVGGGEPGAGNPFALVLRKPITTEKLATALHLSRN